MATSPQSAAEEAAADAVKEAEAEGASPEEAEKVAEAAASAAAQAANGGVAPPAPISDSAAAKEAEKEVAGAVSKTGGAADEAQLNVATAAANKALSSLGLDPVPPMMAARALDQARNAMTPEQRAAQLAKRRQSAHEALGAAHAAAQLATGPAATGMGDVMDSVHDALEAAHAAAASTGLTEVAEESAAEQAAVSRQAMDLALAAPSATGTRGMVQQHQARLAAAQRLTERARRDYAAVQTLHTRVATAKAAKKAAAKAAAEETARLNKEEKEAKEEEKEEENLSPQAKMQQGVRKAVFEAKEKVAAAAEEQAEKEAFEKEGDEAMKAVEEGSGEQPAGDGSAMQFRQVQATLQPTGDGPMYWPDGSPMTAEQVREYRDMKEGQPVTDSVRGLPTRLCVTGCARPVP